MPVKWFICPPDKETIEVDKCLSQRGCRLGERCSTIPYLRKAAQERPWKRVTPSQAGTGPRITYLKQVCDYAINPYDQAFAVIGQGSHGKLSTWYLTKGFISEEGFSDDLIKGIPDLLEPDEEEIGFHILYDYKTSGSYKVRLALGLTEDTDNPKIGKGGQPLKHTSGYKRGKIKYHDKIDREYAKKNILDWSLQLNRYRIVVEHYDFPVSRMICQAIPRDGNTWIATNRGIMECVYLIKIPRLDDKYVLDFYATLQEDHERAFESNVPRICNAWEKWDGRRCKGYCPVSSYCDNMEKDGAIYKPKEITE